MAVTVGELEARLHADVASFVSGMRQASNAFTTTASTIQQGSASMNTLQSAINGVQGSLGALSSKMNKALGFIGAGYILPKIFMAAKTAVVDFNQQVDQASVALTNFLGSASASKKMIGELQDFAAKTPFQFSELLGTTQSMMAMGVAADDVLPRMQAIGDAAAAMGGSPEILHRIQRALGQIQAKGRVQSEELLQLAEAGIPAYQYLADAMGTTTSDLMDSMKKGAVDSTTAVNALLDGMARDFGGMMEAQSKTMMGAMSTVMDYVQMTVGAIFRPFFESLRDAFVAIANLLSSEGMKSAASNFAAGIASVINSIKSLMGAFAGNLKAPFMDLMKSMGNLVKASLRIAGAMKPMLVSVVIPLGGAFIVLAKAITPIVKGLTALVDIVTRNQVVMYAFAALIMAKLVTGFNASGKAAGAFTNVIGGLFSKMGQAGKDAATYFRVLRLEGAGAFTAMRTAAQTAGLSIKMVGVAIKTMMIELLPMMIAFMVIGKLVQAYSARNKDAEERTKELTQAIRENTDAMLAQENALKILSEGGLDPLNNALSQTGKEGEETTNALIALGQSSKDYLQTMRNFKADTEMSAYALAELKGFTAEQAKQMAQYVKTNDKGTDAQHRASMQALGFTEAMIATTMQLEQLDDASENVDFAKMTQEIINATIRTDESTQAFYDQALALAASAKANGQKMSKDEEAIFIYEEFLRLVGDYDKGLRETTKAQDELALATDVVNKRMTELIGGMKEGKVESEQFLIALMGAAKYSKNNVQKAFFDMSVGLGDFANNLKGTSGNQVALTKAGYDFLNMVGENQAQIIGLGGTLGDVDAAMKQMIESFYKQGQAAGWSKEKLQAVLKSVGLLKENGEIILTLDADTKELEKKMKVLAGYGGADALAFGQMQAELARLRDGTRGLNQDLTALNDTLDKSSKADERKNKMLEYMASKVEIAKNHLQGLKDSAEDLRSTIVNAIVDVYSFSNAFSDMQYYQEEYARASEEVAKAQEEVQKAIDSRNIYAYQEAIDKLTEAQKNATTADSNRLTYMQALENQYKKAKQFEEVINRLRAAKLNEEGLRQIMAMGAEQGTAAGNELLNAGATAINQANTWYDALKKSAKESGLAASTEYYDSGIEMAKSLLKGISDTVSKFKIKLKGKSLSAAQLAKMKKDFNIETEFTMSAIKTAEAATSMASGGVVMPRSGGTLARIGEAGYPEAVIPLNRSVFNRVMPNSSGTQNTYEIHVHAGVGDPQEIGKTIVGYLQSYERRYGRLPVKAQ